MPDLGPNGFKLCRLCGVKEVKPPQKVYCDAYCYTESMNYGNWTRTRGEVFKRDKGFCSLCGRDCVAEANRIKALYSSDKDAYRAERKRFLLTGRRDSVW